MTPQTSYDNWRKDGKKAETLDQVIYIVVNEMIKESLFGNTPQTTCDYEMQCISSLLENIPEYTEQELGRPFEELKCEDINPTFLENFSKFLKLREKTTDAKGVLDHCFRALTRIFTRSKANAIAELDFEILGSYEQYLSFVRPRQ